ncbi:MAG: SPASM domain-containing protein [Candidatus Brocadia sp.]|nr:SPASM domain-containing protein [Candidatus Brocadia sp.]
MLTNPLYLFKGIVGRTFYIIPQRPERIQIEITNRCNYTCSMCPRESFNLPENDIPFDLFQKIMDRLESPYNIILTGWGEPLLHPALMDMIIYTKGKGHKVGVTTNGLLLAPFTEKFLETLDKLTISLDSIEGSNEVADGHPSNKVVQKNIESLMKYRDGTTKPVVTIQITMHDKKQCLDTVRFAGEVGADRVYLVRLNNPLSNSGFKRPCLEEELEIYKEAAGIARKYGLQVDNNYTALDSGFLRLLYKQLRPIMYRFDKYCPKPYDYLYINIDGKATPCCDLPRYEVGNVLRQSIDEIWHGENMHYFREHQDDVCGNCDALRLKHIN